MDYTTIFELTFIVLTIGVIITMQHEEKLQVVKKDFSDPLFVGFLVFIGVLIVLGLSSKREKIKKTTVHALVALIIAYFSHVNMIFAVFFLSAIIYYYSSITDVHSPTP